jgi:hypothetical protein
MGVGAGDSDIEESVARACIGGDVHDPVAARAPFRDAGVEAAAAVDENLEGAPDECCLALGQHLVLER